MREENFRLDGSIHDLKEVKLLYEQQVEQFRSETAEEISIPKFPSRLPAYDLPNTGCPALNYDLTKYRQECFNKKIHLELIVFQTVAALYQRSSISQEDLLRMMRNHIRNAINACERGTNPEKCIRILLGLVGAHYCVRVEDNGIPFDANVLVRLGERHNTTWGTGHGFYDTIETLHKCGGSLTVTEAKPGSGLMDKRIELAFGTGFGITVQTYRQAELLPLQKGSPDAAGVEIIGMS